MFGSLGKPDWRHCRAIICILWLNYVNRWIDGSWSICMTDITVITLLYFMENVHDLKRLQRINFVAEQCAKSNSNLKHTHTHTNSNCPGRKELIYQQLFLIRQVHSIVWLPRWQTQSLHIYTWQKWTTVYFQFPGLFWTYTSPFGYNEIQSEW